MRTDEGIVIPLWMLISVITALAAVIGVLWRWGINKDAENKELYQKLLDDKEEKVKILEEFKAKLEQRKNGGTDVRP